MKKKLKSSLEKLKSQTKLTSFYASEGKEAPKQGLNRETDTDPGNLIGFERKKLDFSNEEVLAPK